MKSPDIRSCVDFHAWTFGAGVHASVAGQMGWQVEMYHSEYDEAVFSLPDSNRSPTSKSIRVRTPEKLASG